MTQKKRRSLDDPAALGFVYGEPQPVVEQIESTEPDEPEYTTPEQPKPTRKPRTQSKPTTKPQPTGDFMSKLLDKAADKEPTVRITVDLPQSMHQKLSILCARTNTKKADIIRGLLNEALQQLSE